MTTMSPDGIIAILLTIVGVLIISWVGMASMYIKDKLNTHDDKIEDHDGRIMKLELDRVEEVVHREEMLEILRGMKHVS